MFRTDHLALRRVNLDLFTGESAAIVGPNGAGKSTLLKLISRQLYATPATDSHVRIFGKTRWNVWDLRSRMGIVSADLQHTHRADVLGRDVIVSGFASTIGHVDRSRVSQSQYEATQAIAVQLGVEQLLDRVLGKMSTGQQRRLLLARALIHDPDVLVFDEPASGLDLNARFQLFDTIGQLIQDGRTIVLVTHHIEEIPPGLDRVVLLKAGEVVGDGDKPTVLTNEVLSSLYDLPVIVARENGYYRALPG